MAIESIGRVGEQTVPLQQATVGLEDFLDIFLAQLNFQDPLEPVDNREFIAQLAQFSAIEIANQTSDNTESILEVASISQAVSLLGKEVSVRDQFGGLLAGEVIALNVDTGEPVLGVRLANGDVTQVSPASVTVVREPTE